MARYPRRDILYVWVSGGCGASHTRTVTRGKPDLDWYLNCPQCERQLKDSPDWAGSKLEIPETPDEILQRESLTKAKDRNLQEIQTFAMARMAGIDAGGSSIQKQEQVITCRSGHLNIEGMKFCGECGDPLIRSLPQPVADPPPPEPSPALKHSVPADDPDIKQLIRLPAAQVRQLAEKRGINPNQNKRQLIEALSSA